MGDPRLEELRNRLSDGDISGALQQYDDVSAALDELTVRERGLRTLARGVTARTDASDRANQAASGFVDAAGTARMRRLEHFTEWLAFSEGDMPAEEFADHVDALIDAQEAVETEAERLNDLKTGVPLPVLVAMFGPDEIEVPKGAPIEFAYSLENLGARATADIEVTAEIVENVDEDAFGFSVDPESVDELPGDDTRELVVTGLAAETGHLTVEVDARGEDVAETELTAIDIFDRAGYLERALESLLHLEELVEEKSGEPNGPGAGQGNEGTVPGLSNKLETTRKRLEEILAEVADADDDGRSGDGRGGHNGNGQAGRGGDGNGQGANAIKNRIESLVNSVEAARNQIEGLAGSRLTEKAAGTLWIHAGEIVDDLEAAAEAEN